MVSPFFHKNIAFLLTLVVSATNPLAVSSLGVCSGANSDDFSDATIATGELADDAEGRIDVLCIGAGWAGIGVARELSFHNQPAAAEGSDEIFFVCVDPASAVGGRSVAAHWLAGCEGNPIFEFA